MYGTTNLYIFYCRFTSLGTKKNTGVNPALKIMDSVKVDCYLPAFLLSDEDCEREGRFELDSGAGSGTHQ